MRLLAKCATASQDRTPPTPPTDLRVTNLAAFAVTRCPAAPPDPPVISVVGQFEATATATALTG